MILSIPTSYFHPPDPKRQILFENNTGRIQRGIKTGPTGTRVKFMKGGKQRLPGKNIHIDPFFVIVPVKILKGGFCPPFLRNLKNKRGKDLF